MLAGGIAILSIAVIVSALRMPRPDGWSEAPGLFPLICGVGLLIMATILATSARRPEEGEGQFEPLDRHVLIRTLLIVASVLVYALALIPLLGYTAATFVYLMVVIWYFWGGKLRWILLISLGATAFLSQTFERAFSILLP